MTNEDIITTFTEAWARQDMTSAARYVADDIVFESPMANITGAKPYLEAVGQFAQAVTGLDVITAVSQDDRVIIMYDMHVASAGIIRAAEYFVIRDGKIVSDILVFDTYKLRDKQ